MKAVLHGLLSMLLIVSVASADEPMAKIGEKAPEFTLVDLDGNSHSLADLTKQGKIVVLEWFNNDCPVCAKHAQSKTIINLVNDYQDKGVVVLGIDSTHMHDGKEADVKKKAEEWSINYPILKDFDGKVGRTYGAKTTPHMFVIDKSGMLAYDGAIDDQTPDGTNYVRQALDQVLKGETVAQSKTKPYGCSVKYKKG